MFEQALHYNIFLLLITGLGVSVYMCVAYLFSVLLRNAGIVDVFWSAGFGLIASIYYGVLKPDSISTTVFCAMVILASARLTWHIGQRFLHEYPKEDARYTAFRAHFSKHPELMTFLVFQFQGVLMTLVAIPIYMAMFSSSSLTPLHYIAMGIYIVAWLGETVSDVQLDRFKKQQNTQGMTCRVGLWGLSRHPNYFFQWLLWVSYALFVIPHHAPWSLIAFISPLLMLHFLINVTGVKATEAHALKSRKDYRQYQQSTSMFIPWPFQTVPDFLK